MPQRKLSILLALLGVFLWASAMPARAANSCESLQRVDFSAIPDAPTRISSSKVVDNLRELLGDLGMPSQPQLVDLAIKHIGSVRPYCRIMGSVSRTVGFQLLLPAIDWNGKFLHVGCGGWCGTTGYVGIACAKYPGYACVGTDMGHTGEGGTWFRNNLQAQIDFSYRATHVTTLAGKAIAERFYATRPKRSYFMGCSTGGYQGMVEAQRFPWDFDGIVAGAPDMDESDLAVRSLWIKKSFFGGDGKPVLSPRKIQLLHAAALARCDTDDGVKDGIISDPMHCKFDPGELLCRGEASGDQCLSPSQVQAVRNIYGAPVNSKGVVLSTRGVFPGSENYWFLSFRQIWGDEYFGDTALLSSSDFDFDRDYARSGVGVLFDDTNPDLRRFKATGGKLIVYQGGNDTEETPPSVFDYYETVEKTMGGRAATQDFFRLFTIPGMAHCVGGDGAFSVDYLRYLEAWVEQGQAPEVMIGYHVDGLQRYEDNVLKPPPDPRVHVTFTRPHYPYPQHAKYNGKGDPTRAESFGPAQP